MKKTILITGCSSGIGLCAAEMLHKKGYQVFATARKAQDVTHLKNLGLNSFLLDMDNSDSIQQVVTEILQQTHGKLDVLFNNAGFGQTGCIEDLNRDIIRAQFETNVFGPMELIQHVLPIMRAQGHGRIIQNTSILGIVAMPFYGAYNASKFALEGFSNTLRQELRGSQIFVSIIAPGPIRTHFRENAYQHFQTSVALKESIHKSLYKKLIGYFKNSADNHPPFTLSPEAVVKKLIHAIESRHPKAHYYVGFPAHLFALLRRILPDSLLDLLLIKVSQTRDNMD
jgi:short-subunit dehydrogenase